MDYDQSKLDLWWYCLGTNMHAGEAPLLSNYESPMTPSTGSHPPETLYFVLGVIVVIAIFLILCFVFRKRIKRPANKPEEKTLDPSKEHQGSSRKKKSTTLKLVKLINNLYDLIVCFVIWRIYIFLLIMYYFCYLCLAFGIPLQRWWRYFHPHKSNQVIQIQRKHHIAETLSLTLSLKHSLIIYEARSLSFLNLLLGHLD